MLDITCFSVFWIKLLWIDQIRFMFLKSLRNAAFRRLRALDRNLDTEKKKARLNTFKFRNLFI